MDLSEFKEKYMGKKSRWDFTKFKIVCAKCNSEKVEFNGFLENESGYYCACYINGKIIVKCHECGNAFSIDGDEIRYGCELNSDGDNYNDEPPCFYPQGFFTS